MHKAKFYENGFKVSTVQAMLNKCQNSLMYILSFTLNRDATKLVKSAFRV